MTKRKKEFGRIELPKGTTANERAKLLVSAASALRHGRHSTASTKIARAGLIPSRETDSQVTLDASDIATILTALRLFQREYRDFDSVSIADAWPMHFDVQGDGDDITVVPDPLGSIRIDELCERINCANTLTIAR